MTVSELHFDFKIKQNRVDTLAEFDFNPAQIDWLLNEAQLIFIKQRFTNSNVRKKGFEASQKRIDDLSSLVIKYPEQPELTPVHHSSGNIYEVNLTNLSYPYLFLISGECSAVIATNCTKNIPLRFIQHDDYRISLRDPFNSPSTEFIPYNVGKSSTDSNSSIYVYPGLYSINSVKLEYIKYPSKVSLGTYSYIDGTSIPANTLETPEQTHSEIVDLAVYLATIATKNNEFIQLATQKLIIQE